MKYLPRALGRTLARAMKTFPAVLVTGPRQSGKTTFLRHEIGSSHDLVSLERPDVRERALADPVGFLAEHAPPIVLDEIQYAPELLHYVKEAVDADRRPGRWVLTGSQSLTLMQGVSQSLAGRVAVLVLDPLSLDEVARTPSDAGVDARVDRVFGGKARGRALPDATPELGSWLLRGGFPEPRLRSNVDRQLWFAAYVQTYLERDVRDIAAVGDLNTFSRFLRLIAARTGSVLNMAQWGGEIGVTGPTVKRWISVLEATQLVYLLPPYHRNFGKRLVKSPKLYMTDPGIATFLMGLHSTEAILHGPTIGALTEGAVLSEWLKLYRQSGEVPQMYYWRTSGGMEVDLVMERNARLYGIEVKATATPRPGHADSLGRWLALAGPDAMGVLACRVAKPQALRPGIRAVPWHLAW